MGTREKLLASVRDRVDQVAATGEWAAVLEPAVLGEAHALAACVDGDPFGLEAAYALGWLHYCRAQALPPAQAEREKETAVGFFAGCFIAGVDDLPQSLLAPVAERAGPVAMDLLGRALPTTMDPRVLTVTVTLWRRIALRIGDHHPHRAMYLSSLGFALQSRYRRMGDPADLDEAVEVGRAAVRAAPETHPDQVRYLANLGFALQTRFSRAGETADLEEAVEVARAAVRAARDNHPGYAGSLCNLGTALHERFKRTGGLRDLEEAVEASRAAVRAAPAGHPDQATFLTTLSKVLRGRYGQTGHLTELDEAVEAGRAAVRTVPDDHPGQAAYLANLAIALQERFQRAGELSDVDEAVEAGRAAMRATPDTDPDHAGRLSNVGLALYERFKRTGKAADLEEAVEAGRAAVRATPAGHAERAGRLSNLSNVLRARYRRTGKAADLEEAVEAGRAAVRATSAGHPDHAGLLSNLGIVLKERFKHTRETAVLDEAVAVGRSAVRTAPDNHPDQARYLTNVAIALEDRSERTGAAKDLDEALTLWEQAAEVETAPPWTRIRAANAAARLAASSDPGRAAGLLERAVLMLPEVAPRRLRRADQQHALSSNTAGLAADAAALALADTSRNAQQRAQRALSLAEAGRAVLLSQALETRSDLTDLRSRHPDLAERYSELRELLDQDPAAVTATSSDESRGMGRARHRLAQELEELLARIRTCEGFATFGLPPTLDDLLAEAAHGPVVTFNISTHRSDALLLIHDGITSCPLPQLTQDAVIAQIQTFYEALEETTAPDADRIAAQQRLRHVLEWLWEAAAEPALSALAALGEAIPPAQDGQPLPRVWWAPGGLLGLLPLHAAGFHTDAPGHGPIRRTVLDRAISSYTPTIRTLRHARRHCPESGGDTRSLIIAMPTTPGLSPLPHVAEETRRIQPLLPRPVLLTEPAPDGTALSPSTDTPTAANVLARLPQCAIAHFACHGDNNPIDPSQSRLFLRDHATTPLTVSSLAQVKLDCAQLAYLSACSTANHASTGLLDEAIHLTSAFQLAGFPHVVGTLWPINDRLAAGIAESFYTHLATGPGGTPETGQAATALSHAIRAARDRYPATPSLWAAYLHAGA
ncbi:CHAT domain-containing protein [Streptomyces sp. NPDC005393]|uniref:CHAT domain-containing protein n=1 Tax=Streptomyces sp. NPDC005393 TaxID=3157041 RepID=UPI0033A8F148